MEQEKQVEDAELIWLTDEGRLVVPWLLAWERSLDQRVDQLGGQLQQENRSRELCLGDVFVQRIPSALTLTSPTLWIRSWITFEQAGCWKTSQKHSIVVLHQCSERW